MTEDTKKCNGLGRLRGWVKSSRRQCLGNARVSHADIIFDSSDL